VNLAQAAERVVQRALEPLEDLGAAPGVGQAQQQVGIAVGQAQRAHLAVHPDEVSSGELGEDQLAALGVHLERLQQRRVQGRVAEAHPVVIEAGSVQRGAQHPEYLGGARGAGHADQLHARLQQLAALAPLRAHAAIGVGDVAEAQRRLGVGVAGGHHPGDGYRHIGPEHQDGPVLVEHTVCGPGPADVGP
jgi:hypothetical protein